MSVLIFVCDYRRDASGSVNLKPCVLWSVLNVNNEGTERGVCPSETKPGATSEPRFRELIGTPHPRTPRIHPAAHEYLERFPGMCTEPPPMSPKKMWLITREALSPFIHNK